MCTLLHRIGRIPFRVITPLSEEKQAPRPLPLAARAWGASVPGVSTRVILLSITSVLRENRTLATLLVLTVVFYVVRAVLVAKNDLVTVVVFRITRNMLFDPVLVISGITRTIVLLGRALRNRVANLDASMLCLVTCIRH